MQMPYVNDVLRIFREKDHIKELVRQELWTREVVMRMNPPIF